MIKIAQPIPHKRETALCRLKQARRSGLAFKPSPSAHPSTPCYILSVNELANSLRVDPNELTEILALIGLTILPGERLLEPDTTLALRTAFGTRA